ncbi:unnamed protein product [Cuscuta epithymum]|uniref:Uncharacterized protein n=1 Tax=Cuscuta epithymum TaxID=186058 RepID=A0AAV0FJ41_9ASTE|nr:unnamed protein product [Cuscuta epithymum]
MEYMAQNPRPTVFYSSYEGPRSARDPKHSGPSSKEPKVRPGYPSAIWPKAPNYTGQPDLSIQSYWEKKAENRSLRHFRAFGTWEAFGCTASSATQSPRPRGEPSANNSIIKDSLWRHATTAFNAASHPPTAFNAVHMRMPVPPD